MLGSWVRAPNGSPIKLLKSWIYGFREFFILLHNTNLPFSTEFCIFAIPYAIPDCNTKIEIRRKKGEISMKTVTLKVVFDRKHVADNTKNTGLVQVEVIYDRRQMFISTGILKASYEGCLTLLM